MTKERFFVCSCMSSCHTLRVMDTICRVRLCHIISNELASLYVDVAGLSPDIFVNATRAISHSKGRIAYTSIQMQWKQACRLPLNAALPYLHIEGCNVGSMQAHDWWTRSRSEALRPSSNALKWIHHRRGRNLCRFCDILRFWYVVR